MYQDLVEMERQLDWTVSRKKVEVQDALGRTMTVCAFFNCIITVSLMTEIRLTDEPHAAVVLIAYGVWSDMADWRGCAYTQL